MYENVCVFQVIVPVSDAVRRKREQRLSPVIRLAVLTAVPSAGTLEEPTMRD